jgi:hypothetical protein
MAGPLPSQEREHQHCKICYSTLAGNRCVYGSPVYPDCGTVKLMAYMTNLVLAAIKERHEGS